MPQQQASIVCTVYAKNEFFDPHEIYQGHTNGRKTEKAQSFVRVKYSKARKRERPLRMIKITARTVENSEWILVLYAGYGII